MKRVLIFTVVLHASGVHHTVYKAHWGGMWRLVYFVSRLYAAGFPACTTAGSRINTTEPTLDTILILYGPCPPEFFVTTPETGHCSKKNASAGPLSLVLGVSYAAWKQRSLALGLAHPPVVFPSAARGMPLLFRTGLGGFDTLALRK